MTMVVAQPIAPQSLPVPPKRGVEVVSPQEIKAEVKRLMQDFSVEVTPGELVRLKALPAELPLGSRV